MKKIYLIIISIVIISTLCHQSANAAISPHVMIDDGGGARDMVEVTSNNRFKLLEEQFNFLRAYLYLCHATPKNYFTDHNKKTERDELCNYFKYSDEKFIKDRLDLLLRLNVFGSASINNYSLDILDHLPGVSSESIPVDPDIAQTPDSKKAAQPEAFFSKSVVNIIDFYKFYFYENTGTPYDGHIIQINRDGWPTAFQFLRSNCAYNFSGEDCAIEYKAFEQGVNRLLNSCATISTLVYDANGKLKGYKDEEGRSVLVVENDGQPKFIGATTKYRHDDDPDLPHFLCISLIKQDYDKFSDSIFHPGKILPRHLEQMTWNAIDNQTLTIDAVHQVLKITVRDQAKMRSVISLAETITLNLPSPPIPPPTATERTANPIGPLGWLLNLITDTLIDINQGFVSFLFERFLTIDVSKLFNNELKTVWSTIRSLANLFLLIVFLIVIFSQITNFGISNYGIKNILPKIIAGAILVNASLLLAQVLIDLSNISGHAIFKQFNDTSADINLLATKVGNGLIGNILGILILIITLLVGFLAAVINILLLSARDALVLLLIIFSPLGLVSAILPSTEKISKTWWKAMTAVLIIYPVAAVFIGGGKLSYSVISSIDNGNIGILIAILTFSSSIIMMPFAFIRIMGKIDGISKIPLTKKLSSMNPISIAESGAKAIKNTDFYKFNTEKNLNKKLAKIAQKTGSSFTVESAMKAQAELQKKQSDASKMFSSSDAEKIITALANNITPTSLSTTAYNNYQSVLAKFGKQKTLEIMTESYLNNNTYINGKTLASAIAGAGSGGKEALSQLHSKGLLDKSIKNLKDKGDFRSIGILKALEEFYSKNYGQIDNVTLNNADSYTLTTPAEIQLNQLITKHTEKQLDEIFTHQKSNNKLFYNQLNALHIEKGSVAHKVFIDKLNNDIEFRDLFMDNYENLKTEVKDLIPKQSTSTSNMPDTPSYTTEHTLKSYARQIDNLRKEVDKLQTEITNQFNYMKEEGSIPDHIDLESYIANNPELNRAKQQLFDKESRLNDELIKHHNNPLNDSAIDDIIDLTSTKNSGSKNV